MAESSTPVARSPLAPASFGEAVVVDGWEFIHGNGHGPVAVADCSALAKVQVRTHTTAAVVGALGACFGRAAWVGNRMVVGSGPDEWLVLGAPGTADEIASNLLDRVRRVTEGLTTVLDLTHGRALMRVSGSETLSLLRRVTAVDLDDRLVPDGSALRTSVARVVSDVIRDDHEGQPSYLLHCERSSGRYLQQSLLDAGSSLGVVSGASVPGRAHRREAGQGPSGENA